MYEDHNFAARVATNARYKNISLCQVVSARMVFIYQVIFVIYRVILNYCRDFRGQ
jgi:hypothetical protein